MAAPSAPSTISALQVAEPATLRGNIRDTHVKELLQLNKSLLRQAIQDVRVHRTRKRKKQRAKPTLLPFHMLPHRRRIGALPTAACVSPESVDFICSASILESPRLPTRLPALHTCGGLAIQSSPERIPSTRSERRYSPRRRRPLVHLHIGKLPHRENPNPITRIPYPRLASAPCTTRPPQSPPPPPPGWPPHEEIRPQGRGG
jgi:hypothetical protein